MPRKKPKFRSKFEETVFNSLKKFGVQYEPCKFSYTIEHEYKPDMLLANGVYLELKGRWFPGDRAKLKAVKQQYPSVDLRLVFMKATPQQIKWAEKNKFKWASKAIPKDWLR